MRRWVRRRRGRDPETRVWVRTQGGRWNEKREEVGESVWNRWKDRFVMEVKKVWETLQKDGELCTDARRRDHKRFPLKIKSFWWKLEQTYQSAAKVFCAVWVSIFVRLKITKDITKISLDLSSTQTSVRAAEGIRTRPYRTQPRAYGVSQQHLSRRTFLMSSNKHLEDTGACGGAWTHVRIKLLGEDTVSLYVHVGGEWSSRCYLNWLWFLLELT